MYRLGMLPVLREHVTALRDQVGQGVTVQEALATVFGAMTAGGGVWRFYSATWPGHGIAWWNTSSPWREHWDRYLPRHLFSFGEDIFGNQLVILPGQEAVYLLDHENAESHSLYLGPTDLLSTVVESGLHWVDFYANSALQLAREFGAIPDDSHLHWIRPLMFGGTVERGNVAVVGRDDHLVGHAKIWSQICGLPPGTEIVPGRD